MKTLNVFFQACFGQRESNEPKIISFGLGNFVDIRLITLTPYATGRYHIKYSRFVSSIVGESKRLSVDT